MSDINETRTELKIKNIPNDVKTSFSVFKMYENEGFPSNRFMNIMDIIPAALTIFVLYPLAYELLSIIKLHNALVNIFMLFVYIIMLLLASKSIQKRKNNKSHSNDFELNGEEISAVFNLILLLHTLCFSVLGVFKGDTSYLTMASLSITLYVGFTVSIEELFSGKSNFCRLLLKPFSTLRITKRDWWKIAIIIFLTIAYTLFIPYILILVVFSLIIFVIMISCGKKKAQSYVKEIMEANDMKDILIVHIGAENAMTKTIMRTFTKTDKTNEITEQQLKQHTYDTIIVLNTITKRKFLTQCKHKLQINFKEKTYVFDPFINKKAKRSVFSSWFCLHPSSKKWCSIKEYIKIFE